MDSTTVVAVGRFFQYAIKQPGMGHQHEFWSQYNIFIHRRDHRELIIVILPVVFLTARPVNVLIVYYMCTNSYFNLGLPP